MLFYLLSSSKKTAGNSHVETASIAGGAVLSLVCFSVITFFYFYLKKHTKKPNEFDEVESQRVIERYWWNSMIGAEQRDENGHRRRSSTGFLERSFRWNLEVTSSSWTTTEREKSADQRVDDMKKLLNILVESPEQPNELN